MVRGVFVGDPFAEAVASTADPDEILDFLVTIGWTAARIDIWSVPCSTDVVLNTYKLAVDAMSYRTAQAGVLDEVLYSAFQATIADPCPPETCVPVMQSHGQMLVLSEGDANMLLAEGLLLSSDGYTAVPERVSLTSGQVMVAGVLYNTGTMPAVLQMGNGVITTMPAGALAVVIDTYDGCKNQCKRILPIISPTAAWATMCIDARCFCTCWANQQESPPTWLGTLPDCPCQLTINPTGQPVNPDPEHWYDPETGSQTYHPGSSYCMRSIPAFDGGPGQQCCYDLTGALITVGGSAGTPDSVAPDGWWDAWTHWEEDVAPFNYCKEAGLLDCYYPGHGWFDS